MTSSKFDMRLNPVYQVDYSAASKGKRISGTKRNVTFRFGFSNPDAIAQGLKGMHCRGEEHEVKLTWSLTSGKRYVHADSEEVHFSQGKRTELKFECSWTMRGNHVVKLVAHAAPSLLNNPDFRQFDLVLDGLSFFNMPCIFELGLPSSTRLAHRNNARAADHMSFAAGHLSVYERSAYLPEEENHWDRPEQTHDFRYKVYQRPSLPDVRSLPPAPEQLAIENSPVDLMSAPATGSNDLLEYTPAPPALVYQALSAPPAPVSDEFAPAPTPQPTFHDVSNQILSAYGTPPTTPFLAIANESHTFVTPSVSTFENGAYNSPGSPVSAVTTPSGFYTPPATFETHFGGDSPTSVRQLSELEKAMQDLVNLEDISAPAMSAVEFTMQKKDLGKKSNMSQPLTPTVPAWHLGTHASLADIKANAAPRPAPAHEVMRTHAFDPAMAQAGMMVVYGSKPTEAPPIQHNNGFHAYGLAYAH